ncbi:NACHT C-terminal helical domain 2-containing protein [Nodularia spumigena]|uniref:NACHT C-terminal helical domain 2-containing protein n=1 Tax=Nodularia spumigena TaxID=70799 RepID=UPI00233067D8|nr:NACHT domain-containing protein [Nodularia spumigena]MDB9346526.1 NACHT domain-containing protein [Nodularia spumigena CS-588/01]MDB9353292.1 NACHT domain-containing protein [Nodularia spumigena CS-588/05]
MAKPTLQASLAGIQIIKESLTKQGLTQKMLADRLGLHRSVISALLNGKPILLDNFLQIGEALGFDKDWYKLTTPGVEVNENSIDSSHQNEDNIASLVKQVRRNIREIIQEWCGTMRVLDMSQPIRINQIYTDVNILEKLTAHRRKTIKELLAESNLEDLERFGLGRVTEERVPGESAVTKYKKLIVLGKPGAGKTTFLKYLALQCNKGLFMPNFVPIFINLKYFAESPNSPALLEYMGQIFAECGVNFEQIQELFVHKSVLVLLDGLDEVKNEHYERTLNEIRNLSRIYYDNYFIITCRIAAKEYSYDVLDKFAEVELADFNEEQIKTFISQWLESQNKSLISTKDFIKSLKKNDRLSQLVVTPLLLTLICLVFDEKCNFPNNRCELYTEGIEILLNKWDAKRGIQREQVYQELSLQRKKDLLSYIAFKTFKEKEFFFSKKEAKLYIKEYIQNLSSNADREPEELQLDSEAILHAIEAQHGILVERAKGIYSFSHLTFHEYFVAREINIRKRPQREAFQELANHLSDRYWKEIFLLSAEMAQPDATLFFEILKERIDKIIEENQKIQDFLVYVQRQSLIHQTSVKLSAIRAFYFDIDFDIDQERRLSLLLDPAANYLVCGSFFARVFQETSFEEGIHIAENYDKNTRPDEPKISEVYSANKAMYIAVQYALKSRKLQPELRTVLEKIYQNDAQINHGEIDEEKLKILADKSRSLAKKNRHIGSNDWQFNEQDKNLLKQYYQALLLLVECLNADCIIQHEFRKQLLDSVLLHLDSN